ncbi:MAG: TetR/AcrR family transcriptional regulator [Nocardioidaceae bacterium]|nr:TetR/AcrR family transcriptional regulator [Nocardioidaceae bacterium]NUS52733.1 TetR/AcrR family transcriptional regulator [Nocardioidaceae bacterium]
MSRPDRLRADARRNHDAILAAARDVVIERGAGAPLDEIARRAGVGIGTLYRRFADRGTLLTAVVRAALEQSRDSAERASAEAGPDGTGLDALARYMHDVLDVRVSAVIPQVLDVDDLDRAAIAEVREQSAAAVERLIGAAHDDGSLPREVSFGDVGTLLVRLSRPLPGPVPAEVDAELAHRHLDLVLAGLRAGAEPLDEKGLSRAELSGLRDDEQS